MTQAGNRFRRRVGTRGAEETRFGRMLVLSLAIHLLGVFLTAVSLHSPSFQTPSVTYRVELVTMPVAAPRAGRPTTEEAVAAIAQPAPITKAPAVKPLPVPAPLKTSVKTATKKAPPDQAYDAAQNAIKDMQRKQEIADLKTKLEKLTAVDQRQKATSPTVIPGESDTDKGKDSGSSYESYIRQELKRAWTLSRYQLSNLNLSAEVTLTFDPRGTLNDYRFLRRSGDARFDESLQRAILDMKQLPSAPGQTFTLKATFNLKDLNQ